jgi:AcrR family transcriptional regulator
MIGSRDTNLDESKEYIRDESAPHGQPAPPAHVSAGHRGRRRPRQERARHTVAAILQATAELIADLGYDRTSTNRIAERAGVSIGSLYQYFANKEEILGRLMEDHHRAVHQVVARSLQVLADPAVPLEQGLRCLFAGLVELHREDPVLTRALSSEVPRVHPTGHRHGEDPYVQHLEALLRSRADVSLADPRTAAWIVVRTTEALTRGLVHDPPTHLRSEATVEAAVRMLVGFLSSG